MVIPNPLRFLKALLRFAERPATAPDSVAMERLRLCGRCPFNDGGQCRKCTCIIHLKAILATEECPDARWGQYYSSRKNGLPRP